MAESPKQCGDCSLCCKVLRIAELNKPKDVWCPNFSRGCGCSIYADRPPSCHDFSCLWLTDAAMGPEWKPSVCKMVLDSKSNALVVHVDPSANQPWRAEPYFSVLKQLAVQGQKARAIVLVIERKRNIAILPDREVDLGLVGADARIGIELVNTPTGPQWQPRVMEAGEIGRNPLRPGPDQ
jgi:hypothetical protein